MYNFIVNLKAGKGKTRRALRKIERFMKEHNIPYAVHDTYYPGHAIEIAHKISSTEEGGTIIAVGGDGTFNEVLNGVNPEETVLGFIPAGNGNDFARVAGFSLDPLEALQDIINDKVVEVDYMLIGDENNQRRCLNVAGTGLDVDVLLRYNRSKIMHNKLQYYICLIRSLIKFKSYSISVTIDGKTSDHDCFMVAVGNGQYIGGGMRVSPNSDIYDGKLDVVIINNVPKRRIPGVLLKFLKGKHIELDFTEVYKVEEVSLVNNTNKYINVDGEIMSTLPFNVKVIPKGLRMYAPSSKMAL